MAWFERPGVLINANARRGRDPRLLARLAALAPPERIARSGDAAAIVPAVEGLLERGIDALVLVGGDGTLAGTLTPLLRRFDASELPPIAPTRGGTVNTVAGSLGVRGDPQATLAALLGAGPVREERRSLVSVRADAGEPAHGFLFANGVGLRFLELYYAEPSLGPAAALSVLARVTGSALVGGALARRLFAPFAAELAVDGERVRERRFSVIAAGAVRHLGLGFAPLHSAGSLAGHVHLATTGAGPGRLALELPALRAGARGRCLRHYAIKRAELRSAEPLGWSLDAELFAPARALEISAGPELRLLVAG